MRLSCYLFCRVVDNLGDAGVCWRLARQLAVEYGWSVRLWIDDIAPLAALRPGVDAEKAQQQIDGVDICRWRSDFPAVIPGDVVIEAFACELPPAFTSAMAARSKAPVWINLEYLSAEDWVPGCHGLPSPHPTLPLTKYFFFPGFAAGTAGLIRERDLAPPSHRSDSRELAVSMFCYRNPSLPRILTVWTEGDGLISCRVADGLPRQQVESWLGHAFPVGTVTHRGSLRLIATPFVSQSDYDSRLADCDLNFVRGEDSFVRAQWAGRAFVWQAYPQADDAHFAKLDAFLRLYVRGLEDEPAQKALLVFWHAWNGKGDIAVAWPDFRAALPRLASHASWWAGEAARSGNLAESLVIFCRERLQ
jgi:uncharacterized repeat protein (TIGR03837 family)